MINLKKIDEKDIAFVKKILTKKEDLAFSQFLKNRKKTTKRGKKTIANKGFSKVG